MNLINIAFLAWELAVQGATASAPPDSIRTLRDAARRAEVVFERLSRQLAPIRWGGLDGGQCDEHVGRFCLIYDSGRLPDPAPEPVPVIEARRVAIEALRRSFTFLPADFETAGPLVRYLIEDDRADEAVPAARLFFAESRDSIWGPLLVGFSLHAARRDTTAERYFSIALPRLEPAEQARIDALDWLLGAADRRAYRKLEEEARKSFAEKLWRFSDPLYLTPGNERRNEHLTRHVWSRILAHTPVVRDMVRWGEDLEQLTVRYGIPSSKTRSPGWGATEGSLVEHYDPDQLAWVPEDLLTRGPEPTPVPGAAWSLDATRNRSGYAPATLRRLTAMHHQVSRFPAADGAVLRVDGLFVADSVSAGKPTLQTGFRVMDTMFATVIDRASERELLADSLNVAFEAYLQPGEYVYSLEALEPDTRHAMRARYATAIDSAAAGLRVSDPVITRAWRGRSPDGRGDAAFEPVPRLSFSREDTVGIYAEVHGLPPGRASFDVRLSIEPASRASLPIRIASWIGDRLGLHSPAPPPRLQWSTEWSADGPAILAVDLFLNDVRNGVQVVVLDVVDPRSGRTTTSRRILLIEPGS